MHSTPRSPAGAARKEVYPRLQIEWAGTKERLAAVGDGAAPRVAVGYGVSVTLPILDGGRIRANVAVQDARAQEAMAEYEKAMLTALVDVETSLPMVRVGSLDAGVATRRGGRQGSRTQCGQTIRRWWPT